MFTKQVFSNRSNYISTCLTKWSIRKMVYLEHIYFKQIYFDQIRLAEQALSVHDLDPIILECYPTTC